MEDSPFNRSSRTARSPPPTPAPAPAPACCYNEAQSQDLEVIPTSEIEKWLTNVERALNEVCTIATEGKLNSDQKMRISTLCRKVGYGTSQIAVQYQSLKAKTLRAHSSIHILEDKLDLSQRLQDLKMSIEESSKPAAGMSFAEILKKGTNNCVQPTISNSVAIYPNDRSKSSEDTKSIVQKIICPEQMKLHVRGLRKTRNGGVIISTDSKDDIAKLKKSVQITKSGLTIDETHKRKPRVVIIGVPSSMQEKDVLTCLYNQNLSEKLQCDLDTFLNDIKLSHKSGKKDAESCNYIIEVTATIRKALIVNQRVFINWSSCPVRDFTLVTRCFKCQQYGHAAKSCRAPTYTCGYCGDLGHSIKDCPKKTEDPKCATCLHFKKPSAHSTGAADCPAKIMAEKRYINTVDYEGA